MDKSGWCVVSCTIDDVPTSRRRHMMVNIPSRVIHRVREKTTPSLITTVRGFVRTITVVVERCVGLTWTSLEHTFEFRAPRSKDARQRSEAAAGVTVRRCRCSNGVSLCTKSTPFVFTVSDIHRPECRSCPGLAISSWSPFDCFCRSCSRPFKFLSLTSLQVVLFRPPLPMVACMTFKTNLGTRLKAAERPHFKSRQAAGVSCLPVCKPIL